MGLAMGQKLVLLESRFEGPFRWNLWMHLPYAKFYSIVYTCSSVVLWRFAPQGLAHGPKTCQIWHQRNAYFLNSWTIFLIGIFLICICTPWWSFAHLIEISLPIDQNACLSNCWRVFSIQWKFLVTKAIYKWHQLLKKRSKIPFGSFNNDRLPR